MATLSKIQPFTQKAVVFICVIVSLFHLLNVSGFIIFSDMTIRAIHLMAMMFIGFVGLSVGKVVNGWQYGTGLAFGALSLFVGLYILFRWKAITMSGGTTEPMDVFVGVLAVLLILEATRRTAGLGLTLVALAFLVYPFVSASLPSILRAKTYSFERVFTFLYTSTEGIYGIPISVAANYIILFCIFGAFLNEFGVGEFLYDLSMSITRKLTAAAAKTSIICSALTGMISGSAAGNVAVTGTFTIPMMKRQGHKPEEAGAVEACASTGGQFMPPVMGAAAFIMAEIIGTPYSNIMKAAILPSILYFMSLMFIVHLIAKRDGVGQTVSEEHRKAKTFTQVIKESWYLAIPIVVLICLLISGYSPFKACFYAILSVIVVHIAATRKVNKDLFIRIKNALWKGAADTATIAIACAAAGILVGVLSLTGLGSKLSGVIITLSGGHLSLALIITMIVAIILGMGLPTTAAYLVLASVVAPALADMGIPILTAHMFVFFFGCISTITPPVALASFVAAGIAGASVNKVGWTAFRFGLVSFILPFMFVYSPGLLLNGSIGEILFSVVLAFIGVFAISVSVAGYARQANLNLLSRAGLLTGALLLIVPNMTFVIIGLMLIAAIYWFSPYINGRKRKMGMEV